MHPFELQFSATKLGISGGPVTDLMDGSALNTELPAKPFGLALCAFMTQLRRNQGRGTVRDGMRRQALDAPPPSP